jgi:hypothetical protein
MATEANAVILFMLWPLPQGCWENGEYRGYQGQRARELVTISDKIAITHRDTETAALHELKAFLRLVDQGR